MKSSKPYIVIAILLVIVLIGALSWYATRPDSEQTDDDMSIEPVTVDPTVVPWDGCMTTFIVTDVEGASGGNMSVDYPCEWEITQAGNGMFRVEDADGSASFSWPIPDMGTVGMTYKEDTLRAIQGNEYTTKVFMSEERTVEFIEVPIASAVGYSGIIVTYTDDEDSAILEEILSRLSF